ncbi:helix-turn-helix transcriptional regulator [Histidinibacterium aquaticum]|uniref:Helix-turn-helix transcriptional regulator n=2 Tax=Histidinibacterium aquaticum TaxID=2613962 RepID=A0A5J5GQT0_9RHOB|nr:helix-turn-helix transcriptional regulator [Histidinibacterium aquaticum]
MGAEIFCSRWTPLILREFLCGSTRFNELRRGLPRISPALLSKRLRELEETGLIAREGNGGSAYRLTEAGEALRPIIMSLGHWAQSWVDREISLRNLDPTLLMWDMRRSIKVNEVPPGRRVIHFVYQDLPPKKQKHWLVVDGESVDLCYVDPGFDVDLLVECDLRVMTMIWMGHTSIDIERRAGRLSLEGDRALVATMESWLGLSAFASTPSRPRAAQPVSLAT